MASGAWHNGAHGRRDACLTRGIPVHSYDPDCDYVDGELEDRNVGKKSHAKAQSKLDSGARHPLSVALCGGGAARFEYPPPAIAFPTFAPCSAEPDEEVFTQPPFLCIEVLSPEDRASRIERKIADYLKFGVAISG
jgi:hypothetical protein